MTSEEFRRDPMFLRNQFGKTGTLEMPWIKREDVPLDNLSLIGYDKLKSGSPNQIVHFFLDDYKFEVLWNNPEPRIERLSVFKAVLSPQFSIYTEMPLPVQIYNTFRSRWCGAYLQSKGIPVIPSVVWGKSDSYWFCFEGIERNSIVAVSTIGVRNEKELFMSGYREMLRRLSPPHIICYGKPFEEMEGNVIHISYEETNHYASEANTYDWKLRCPQIPNNLVYEKGGGHAGGSARFPKNDGQIKHIFRKKQGHFADTPENRELILGICNDERYYLGTDVNGVRWYVQVLSDGKQIWVTTRDGIIQNCGVNDAARSWDEVTGLNRPDRKGVVKRMENTPRRRAFLAMYWFLHDLYSRCHYSNLAVVLSDISPYTFKDGMSADPAAWLDFCEFYDNAAGAYSSEFNRAYYSVRQYLRLFDEEWGFPIPYVFEELTLEAYGKYYNEV